jgi:predicted CXXCH cytochrome family protein
MFSRSALQLLLLGSFAIGSASCEGPAGPAAASGEPGGVGRPGDTGPQGQPGSNGERGEQGAAAPPAVTGVQLEPNGLIGTVHDPSELASAGGSIYLVPAADVASLAKQPIDLTLTPSDAESAAQDEPLEDLLDKNASSYQRAQVDESGSYRFTTLQAGSYFVVWKPADGDDYHAPGGSACRAALDRVSLVGTRLDIRVSGRPSRAATYTGSSSCIGCHGRHRSMRSAHRVGLQVPGVRGALQDVSPWPAYDAGLAAFERALTLYYYDCDATRAPEAPCRVASVDPTGTLSNAVVRFELHLARDQAHKQGELGAYIVQIVNRSGGGANSYPVVLTYGGALYRQQYLTQRRNPDGSASYFVLPLQFNAAGLATYPSSDDWPFRDYQSSQWYDFANSRLIEPEAARAFDSNCAGCHFTGMRLTGNPSDGLHARAVADSNGEFDIDGDGRLDEINVGCESCHGPGSEHIESRTRGQRIVSPSLLTPERELVLCGACHSRPQGKAAGGTEAPLSASGYMPAPGVRRRDYLRDFTQRVDASARELYPSGDSKSNHQQYGDFMHSGMYRNGRVLMTCSSCHDAHGSDSATHMLLKAADDNSSCTGCHSSSEFTAPRGHVTKATGFVHDGTEEMFFVCTSCHMVRTASSGARHPELLDALPTGVKPVQYFHGDLASHRFAVTRRDAANLQPVAASLACGFCHGAMLANP